MQELVFSLLVIVSLAAAVVAEEYGIQCQNPEGQPVDWFTAIKLPPIKSKSIDGTGYVYMDARNPEWTHYKGIMTEDSAIGHTVAQMYATTENYNKSIMWIVYNDEPSDRPPKFTVGHSKGVLAGDNSTGFWLVHSVPKFPQLPYEENSYEYPSTGVKYGQSFLCMSMYADELDKVGDQLINNEVLVYGSHFGDDIEEEIYPNLRKATLPHSRPGLENDGVRVENLTTIDGFKMMSVSKNRYFAKDIYEDLLTHLTSSVILTETWSHTKHSFRSMCTILYKTMNIKALTMADIKGLENYWYKSTKDHSKWMVTDNSSSPWTCIGDINHSLEQTKRGGGLVCIDSTKVWEQYKKLVLNVEKC